MASKGQSGLAQSIGHCRLSAEIKCISVVFLCTCNSVILLLSHFIGPSSLNKTVTNSSATKGDPL